MGFHPNDLDDRWGYMGLEYARAPWRLKECPDPNCASCTKIREARKARKKLKKTEMKRPSDDTNTVRAARTSS